MARMADEEFTYLIKIFDDTNEQYYLRSTIDEGHHTILIHLTSFKHSWAGSLNQDEVRTLAKKFPSESKDSFYSHTQRAFSQGNRAESDGRNYAFTCRKLDKNRLEFIWKEQVEALSSLKTVGSVHLQERPHDEVLTKVVDYTIDEMHALRLANEQKENEIERLNHQLNKALETIKRTVDLKEQLETDLYRKFVLVLNEKKSELAKLRSRNEQSATDNGTDAYGETHSPPSYGTLNEFERPTQRLTKRQISHTDTSDDEEIQEIEMTKNTSTQPKLRVVDNNNHDSSLDLGNDQIEYKVPTTNTHHQRRKFVTGASTISTRPFVHHASVPSTMATPSLPDDSQTADELLNKI